MTTGNPLTGHHTTREIGSQPASWDATLNRLDRHLADIQPLFRRADQIIFTGCGSAYNVAVALAPQCQALTGKIARAVHASELVTNPASTLCRHGHDLVIAYSRSGDTTETSLAVEQARKSGASTMAVVCFPQSRMARSAELAIVLEEAAEKSIVTTRSLTSMVLSGQYFSAACSENQTLCDKLKTLPAAARQRMDSFEELGRRIGEDTQVQKFAFLGRDAYFGLAREAQLKIKEMTLLPSDAYTSLDFQHGPMSTVNEQMLITIMVPDAGSTYDVQLAGKMRDLNGRVFIICDEGGELSKYCAYSLELKTALSDGVRNILYMPVLQYMAYYRAVMRGEDPDNPKNLSYYVKLESAPVKV